MSRPSLRQRLREYYGGKRLPRRHRDRLRALLAEPHAASRWRVLRTPGTWAAAVAVLVCGALVYLGAAGMSRSANETSDRDLPTALDVAREVAANHTRGLEPEFPAEDYARLRGDMSKLDFSLIEPSGVAGRLRPVGARYCSVQCAVAAQIRLEDAQSEKHTLYEVADNGYFARIEATEIAVGGVQVRIWREKGLLLCLVSPGR